MSAPAKRGTLVMIPGITGEAEGLMPMRNGLCDAGCVLNIEIIGWEGSRHPIRNLTDLKANTTRARRIANRLTKLYRENPGQPLMLLGNSGGGGLAVLALEMLPKDVVIDRLILTAAAVSHDYDLGKAAAHCRSIVNIFSRADVIVGLGTELFGTIDRKKIRSAGYCGFLDREGHLRKTSNLEQIEWKRAWAQQGHNGTHGGYRTRQWARLGLAQHVMAAAAPRTAPSTEAPITMMSLGTKSARF